MSKVIDLIGKKFDRLLVLKRVENNKEGRTQWLCKCDCGNNIIVTGKSLMGKNTKSCGCLQKEMSKIKNIKHNLHETRLYNIWKAMKQRCYNIKSISYQYYGAKGIIICKNWNNNFKAFYDWSMVNGYADNLTIDRIDVNGNYEPSNCRWVTNTIQQNNKTNNHYITYNEKIYTIAELSKKYKINYATLYMRLNKLKWDIDKALHT